MIKEAYCSFEVAKLLKEKGFDGGCETSYYISNEGCENAVSVGDFTKVRPWRDALIAAPTLQMAMKWLREKYYLHIWVDYSRLDLNEKQPYLWNIVETKIDGNYWGGTYHKTYEEAAELAIKYTLENLV